VNGLHTLYLRVEDDAKQVRLIKWGLEVVGGPQTSVPRGNPGRN
jgi:hypothetical protein